jgi:hypothetical protein
MFIPQAMQKTRHGRAVRQTRGYRSKPTYRSLHAQPLPYGSFQDLSRVARFVKVVVFLNSARHFTEQHVVANGAIDLLVRTFGDRIGRPARSAVGVAALPLGFAVEIEAIVETAD